VGGGQRNREMVVAVVVNERVGGGVASDYKINQLSSFNLCETLFVIITSIAKRWSLFHEPTYKIYINIISTIIELGIGIDN
jgi:hypothetical protein